MRIIAEVNRVSVVSDKPGGHSVNGAIVTLDDGSWCDTNKYIVMNHGPGGIGIIKHDVTAKTSMQPLTVKNHFSARELRIAARNLTIRVDVWERPDVELSMTGPSTLLDTLSVTCKDETLVVHEQGTSHEGHTAYQQASITAYVPRRTTVQIASTHNPVNIGNVEGPLTLNISGDGMVTCGKVCDTNVNAHGGADISILQASGRLAAQITDNAKVVVRDGTVPELSVQNMGSGLFEFRGIAHMSTLSLMGSGNIRVAKTTMKPLQQCMGTGQIQFGPF